MRSSSSKKRNSKLRPRRLPNEQLRAGFQECSNHPKSRMTRSYRTLSNGPEQLSTTKGRSVALRCTLLRWNICINCRLYNLPQCLGVDNCLASPVLCHVLMSYEQNETNTMGDFLWNFLLLQSAYGVNSPQGDLWPSRVESFSWTQCHRGRRLLFEIPLQVRCSREHLACLSRKLPGEKKDEVHQQSAWSKRKCQLCTISLPGSS